MRSILEYFGRDQGHSCGYCDSDKGSLTYGMWGHALQPQDYQRLIDRGWRRSGNYLYKPIMNETCCPQYTIRCRVDGFKLSKSHKKVLRKFRKFIVDGRDIEAGGKQEGMEVGSQEESSNSDKAEERMVKAETKVKLSMGADPDKPKMDKAKDIRRRKALAKQQTHLETKKAKKAEKNQEKTLKDYLDEPFPENSKHKFEIRTLAAQRSNPAFEATFEETHKLYQKYQVKIHKDVPTKCTPTQLTRFLCNSSLDGEDDDDGGEHSLSGAFHQQYLIDGKIVAVGVVDILDKCVSSVYLFYDPDYSFLSLGTLSSLIEIRFCQKVKVPYYYMGFYIHDNPKMRYKAQYAGSDLLCPETYEWIPVGQCSSKLDGSKYARLSDKAKDKGDDDGAVNLDGVLILFERQAMAFRVYKEFRSCEDEGERSKAEDDQEVKTYKFLVGNALSEKMLLFRS